MRIKYHNNMIALPGMFFFLFVAIAVV